MKSGSTELEVVKSAALSGAQERNSYRKKKKQKQSKVIIDWLSLMPGWLFVIDCP